MIPRIHIHERHVLMWLLGVTIATIAAGALWLAVDQRASHKNDNTPTTHLRWMHSGQYSIIADYFDPSVMSLPDARGFSGKAWQYVSLPTPSAYEPDRPTAFLASPANAALPVLLAEKPISELIQAGVEWTMVEPTNSVSIILPVTNSVLEVTGTLCDRGILQQPVLPLAPTGTPVRGARVLVAVTGDGRVRYAVLEQSSGNETLDGAMMAAIRQVWFAPEPNADPLALTWGVVRVVWAARI